MSAKVGDHQDGGGLVLRVTAGKPRRDEQGAEVVLLTAAWVLRYTAPSGKRREMGLGTCYRLNAKAAGESLTAARRKAREARDLLDNDIDPIEHKAARREAERAADEAKRREKAEARETLRRCARAYHEAHIETTKTPKHAAQWINSIEQHLPADLLDKPINKIGTQELLDALVPVCRKVPETGSRIFQRLAVIFDAAIIDGLRETNPAAPMRRELVRRAGAKQRGEFAHMPYGQLPEFIARLREAEGTAARCLEFLILTASRTGEALGAQWSEIDPVARQWVVPAGRMKRKGEGDHVVYLSDRALQILDDQRGQHGRYVFPSPSGRDQALSNMALAMTLRRLGAGDVTVHGFRKSFSTWANESGHARPDVIEACLAHKERDRIRRAYNKAQFIGERKTLLQTWADFCDGRAPLANVLAFAAQRAA